MRQARTDALTMSLPDGKSVLVVLSLVTATACGVLVSTNSVVALAGGLAVLAAVAITRASVRFALVIAGALLVLGSSESFDATKLVYLLWVAMSAVVAIGSLARSSDGVALEDAGAILLASGATAAAVTLSLFVAQAADTAFMDSIRDSAPYALLAVAPVLAWDGAHSRIGPRIVAVIVLSGLAASAGFAVEFVARRGLADLPITSLGLGSSMLPALTFAVAVAGLLSGQRFRIAWVGVAALILTLLLLTGTRSVLLLLVVPAAMLIASQRRFLGFVRLGAAAIAIGLAIAVLVYVALQMSSIDVSRVVERFGSLVSGTDLATDQSYVERVSQVSAAVSAFSEAPILGVGLGYRFEWVRIGGEPYSFYVIDTGLSLAAKFGTVGVLLLATAAVSALRVYWRRRRSLPEHVRLTGVGFVAAAVATIPLGNPVEDKGFGLAVAMLLAWILVSTPSPQNSAEPAGPAVFPG